MPAWSRLDHRGLPRASPQARPASRVEDHGGTGTLVPVLGAFAAPPNGIYAVFPQRKHLPLRLRLWIDFLKHHYGDRAYWQGAALG